MVSTGLWLQVSDEVSVASSSERHRRAAAVMGHLQLARPPLKPSETPLPQGRGLGVDAEDAVHLCAPRTEMVLCILPGSRKVSSPIEIHGSQKSVATCPQHLMDIR